MPAENQPTPAMKNQSNDHQEKTESRTAKGIGSSDLFGELSRIAKQCEMFLVESPSNRYQPAPPEGWFAMRSEKRRIFLQLENGKRPNGDRINAMIGAGEFTEHPLFSPNKTISEVNYFSPRK